MFGTEAHDEDVDGYQDAASADAASSGDHETDGGEEETVVVGGVQGEEGFVVGGWGEEAVF
eukprot:scaffold12371_cov97-Alexandrium_tamarense.AAC.1